MLQFHGCLAECRLIALPDEATFSIRPAGVADQRGEKFAWSAPPEKKAASVRKCCRLDEVFLADEP
jgi:hypothetical protein